MIYVFYIFAAILVWFSYKSFRGGLQYLNYFKQELAKPPSNFTPFVSVIAPCKGLDPGLHKNLSALLELDYPEFEIVFVIDDANDPAAAIIRELLSENLRGKLVVAEKAATSGQKAENLREGVFHADPNSEVFVFVDSDARPNPDWLRALVAPLEVEGIGAATGYRWFISERPTLSSELRNMWNASIASALGPNEASNFCWGGSMAIRRDTFVKLKIRDIWKNVVSDDFAVTDAVNDAGMRIKFVPQALTPSIENCTFRELVEFTNRQMKITRVYASKLWLMSFIGSALFCGVMLSAFSIVLFSRTNSATVLFAMLVLILVSLFSIGKSTLRLHAVSMVLKTNVTDIRKQYLSQNVLWLFTPFLFLGNCVAALLSRTIEWRGTTYKMLSANKTLIIKNGNDPSI